VGKTMQMSNQGVGLSLDSFKDMEVKVMNKVVTQDHILNYRNIKISVD
jgi:hypothetical protein